MMSYDLQHALLGFDFAKGTPAGKLARQREHAEANLDEAISAQSMDIVSTASMQDQANDLILFDSSAESQDKRKAACGAAFDKLFPHLERSIQSWRKYCDDLCKEDPPPPDVNACAEDGTLVLAIESAYSWSIGAGFM